MPVNTQRKVAEHVHHSLGHANAEPQGAPLSRVLSSWGPRSGSRLKLWPACILCWNIYVTLESNLLTTRREPPPSPQPPRGRAARTLDTVTTESLSAFPVQVSYFLYSIASFLPTNPSTAIIIQYLVIVINIRLSKLDGERVKPMSVFGKAFCDHFRRVHRKVRKDTPVILSVSPQCKPWRLFYIKCVLHIVHGGTWTADPTRRSLTHEAKVTGTGTDFPEGCDNFSNKTEITVTE